MKRSHAVWTWFHCLLAFAAIIAGPAVLSAQKVKLPRPRILEHGIALERDPATGELGVHASGDSTTAHSDLAPDYAPAIRSRVALVQVGCTVTAPDGTSVRGLTKENFHVFENGAEQTVASFDAANTGASIVLVLDASPSVYRELGEEREAAQSLAHSLQPEDEVAVVAFAGQTNLLLPFSKDRKLLAVALASPQLANVANSSQSFIYQAAYLTAHELLAGRAGRKAIVLVTDGQDSGLRLDWDPVSMQPGSGASSPLAFEDVARQLAADGVDLDVVSTEPRPHALTPEWLAANHGRVLVTSEARRMEIPQYTIYLAEMVREVGGNLYFLGQLGSLAEVYRRIALALGTEYTVGYYPESGTSQPGWRTLRVELNINQGCSTLIASHLPERLLRPCFSLANGQWGRYDVPTFMFTRKRYQLKLPSYTLALGERTLLMGVLNVTPDSFSDGGQFLDTQSAVAHGLALQRAGADILDIGGESTRPGAEPVNAQEELARVKPVIERLRAQLRIPISLDTQKAEVAEAGIAAGAEIINNVSALRADPALAKIVRQARVGLILMHMRGVPRTMQNGPFARDVVRDVVTGLREALGRATKAGILRSKILLDPGIGFGKRHAQSFELLGRLPELARLGQPLVVGVSRKSFLTSVNATNGHSSPAEQRQWGTAAGVTASILGGAHIVRVHDVEEMRQVARIADEIAASR